MGDAIEQADDTECQRSLADEIRTLTGHLGLGWQHDGRQHQ